MKKEAHIIIIIIIIIRALISQTSARKNPVGIVTLLYSKVSIRLDFLMAYKKRLRAADAIPPPPPPISMLKWMYGGGDLREDLWGEHSLHNLQH